MGMGGALQTLCGQAYGALTDQGPEYKQISQLCIADHVKYITTTVKVKICVI